MKQYLDNLVKKYETTDFIKNDPVQFAHRFSKKQDIEIASFIAALFSFGRREAFIQKLNLIFEIMHNSPFEYILEYHKNQKEFSSFVYRFVKYPDINSLLLALNKLYREDNSSLEELFCNGYRQNKMFEAVNDFFYSTVKTPELGFCHLFAKVENGGALKRMNMFLRWMIRRGPVDIGLWDFIGADKLLIPLDTHVARVSRELGLLSRKSNDFKSVIELTEKLKEFDESDPVKYDFALFGAGIDQNNDL